ncbi:MAG: hypothetical protein ACYC0X_21025 [Pirellulaceae bacterium]
MSFDALWVCILVATVLVFIVSSALHMILPIHKGDYLRLPNETELLAAMRKQEIAPGAYSFPFPASMKDMASPEMIEKYRQGPVGLLTVLRNGVPALSKSLAQWLVYLAIVSIFVAYLASIALTVDAGGMQIFRFTSTAALLAYGVPHLHESIWKGQSWIITGKYILDGVLYSLVSGGTFTLLWPGGH